MELHFDTFVRKPFTVEAIQVTEENLKSVAKLIGQVQREPNGTRYIQTYKRKVPNITRVYVGYWVTKVENSDAIRAYSDRTFKNQFVKKTPLMNVLATGLGADTETKEVANG